uniref:Potassium channel domain-containing protein n=1 Tax=Parascaris univalens TaxID=6257 RepID=A0A915AD58_PARUN
LHSYEKWTFGQAFYWAFISMSSIGFGDIVPERTEMFPITIAYILIGLALASMCIDTSAAYYIRKIHFFGRKMKSAQATVSDLIRLSVSIVQLSDSISSFFF